MGRIEPIGDFQPFAELARRPATIVYKAYQSSLERFVLLKVLRPEYARDEDLARRFEAEARLLARIQHPNVVAVYACGRHGEHLYLAAEYVEGTDLAALLRHGPLPPALALYVAREAARGLQAAHAQGILHRDLKPGNILVALDGQVKLTDFGMASLAAEHEAEHAGAEVRGTPAYLAPEQILGGPPTEAADLFALGATLFEMLTGRPAFTGRDTGAVFDAILHHDPTPALAGLPEALVAVCRRLLARDPAERFAGAAEVLDALDAAAWTSGLQADPEAMAAYVADPTAAPPVPAVPPAETPPEPAPPPTAPPPRAVRPPTRRPRVLTAALLLLAVAVSAYWLIDGRKPPTLTRNDGTATRLTADSNRTPALLPSVRPAPDSTNDGGDTTAVTERRPDTDTVPPGEVPVRPAPDRRTTAGTATDPTALSRDTPPSTPPPAPGRLRIVSEPWAIVYLNGDSAGVTPLHLDSLPPGPHRLTLRHPEIEAFPPYEQTVELRPGEQRTVTVPLWDHVGRLVLIVSPWAEVYLDDVYRDTVPPQRQPLIVPPGPHTLTLKHPRLGTWSTPIHVAPGRIDTLRVPLQTLLRQ